MASHELFQKLSDAIKDHSWDEAVKIATKILQINPEDHDALKCKVLSLVKGGKYEEVVAFTSTLQGDDFLYERLFSLYRLKKYPQCIAGLGKAPKTGRFLSLRGQILYHMERYADAAKVFQEAVARTEGPKLPTVLTNLTAALLKARLFDGILEVSSNYLSEVKRTYDLAFNIACCHIERGEYSKAMDFLNVARAALQASSTPMSPEEIHEGEAAIKAQEAFVLQKNGEEEKAYALYQEVEASKPEDKGVWSVVANNMIVLKPDHDRLDALNKFKKMKTDSVQDRLQLSQKETIGFNHGLLLLQMNKNDECRDLVKKLQEDFPKNDLLPLLNASLLVKEFKVQKSQTVLEEFISKYPASSDKVRLSMAQMHIGQKNIPAALQLLENIESLVAQPRFVATVVALYQTAGDLDGASRALDKALAKTDKKDPRYSLFLSKAAELKISLQKHAEAATLLRGLYELDPKNISILASLVVATAFVDPESAIKLAAKLPPLPDDGKPIDVDSLESLAAPVIKKKDAQVEANSAPTGDASAPIKKKKTKKRKNKPPKGGIDPNIKPDPERWLPKHQRSDFKGKKKGNKNRGAQGSIAASVAEQNDLAKQGIKLKAEELEEKEKETGRGGRPAPAPVNPAVAKVAGKRQNQRGRKR